MLANDLRDRGVDDPGTLPDFPYRDDALIVHSALREWVEAFVRSYYAADTDVQSDWEVQAMFHEAGSADGGRLIDIPTIGTIQALVDALTHIIFTGSVQHAAVNFPQLSIMAYAPAFPLSGFRPVGGNSATEEEWLDMLPPLYHAQYQANLGMLLGSVHYTQLGRYPLGLLGGLAQDHRLIPHLVALRRRLRKVEKIIQRRNEAREPYPFLLPSKIPQSINI
jgi:arachidonate 15-lipoxygenase